MQKDSLKQLRYRLRQFAAARDWDQFHSPKNLSMALAGEVGELLEHFQWLTEKQSQVLSEEQRQQVTTELADILIYLVRLADKLDVDLIDAADQKIETNESKYPPHKVRGDAKKYDEY